MLLALLAAEASHGYQLRARLALALGPLAGALNDGQVYVTLNRLEKAGLLSSRRVGQADRPDRKVYELTPAGRDQVTEWLRGHELAQAGAGRIPPQARGGRGSRARRPGRDRRPAAAASCCVGLGQAQRAALAEPDGSVAALLLEGVVLRLQADLRWLEACARYWNSAKER